MAAGPSTLSTLLLHCGQTGQPPNQQQLNTASHALLAMLPGISCADAASAVAALTRHRSLWGAQPGSATHPAKQSSPATFVAAAVEHLKSHSFAGMQPSGAAGLLGGLHAAAWPMQAAFLDSCLAAALAGEAGSPDALNSTEGKGVSSTGSPEALGSTGGGWALGTWDPEALSSTGSPPATTMPYAAQVVLVVSVLARVGYQPSPKLTRLMLAATEAAMAPACHMPDLMAEMQPQRATARPLAQPRARWDGLAPAHHSGAVGQQPGWGEADSGDWCVAPSLEGPIHGSGASQNWADGTTPSSRRVGPIGRQRLLTPLNSAPINQQEWGQEGAVGSGQRDGGAEQGQEGMVGFTQAAQGQGQGPAADWEASPWQQVISSAHGQAGGRLTARQVSSVAEHLVQLKVHAPGPWCAAALATVLSCPSGVWLRQAVQAGVVGGIGLGERPGRNRD